MKFWQDAANEIWPAPVQGYDAESWGASHDSCGMAFVTGDASSNSSPEGYKGGGGLWGVRVSVVMSVIELQT